MYISMYKYKRILVLIFTVIQCSLLAQKSNHGYVIEYNAPISTEFIIYSTPFKITKVKEQQVIDYSKVSGLLQSYLSATNLKWAKSDYLDQHSNIGRDKEHFDAVKKQTLDYIQIDHIYKFQYFGREMVYLKYSYIFEKLPFPIIGIFSLELVDNRWYFSNLLNQGAIYDIFRTIKSEYLINCFDRLSNNSIWNEAILKSTDKNGRIVLSILSHKVLEIKNNNKEFFDDLRDSRLVIKDAIFRNAELNSKPSKYKFDNISHPFVYDNFEYEQYSLNQKNLVKDEKTVVKFKNTPELPLLSDIPIDLLGKVIVTISEEQYTFISYRKEGRKNVTMVVSENGVHKITTDGRFSNIASIMMICKPTFLEDILQKNISDSMKEFIKGSDGGTNIDLALQYIQENKASLSKYLDE